MKLTKRALSSSLLMLSLALQGCHFPDPTENLEPDSDCESVLDADVPGATSYFVGDFDISGDTVTGMEYWILFANTPWQELDGEDCQVQWQVEGSKGEAIACSACQYSLNLNMEVDRTTSTCPEGLTPSETDVDASFSVSYDVFISENNETTFYFDSGNLLGAGYTRQGRLTYISQGTCKWF